ncbi:MAG TPA: hypothetical protein VFR56_09455 [Actinomycetes bacterium]|nr:hypothetical protein [Actinomycetes bacterium]
MSESTIPFQGQTAVLDRPLNDLGEPVEEPGGGNRNKLLALGGLAGVLVLAVLAYFLFFAGGEEPVADDGPAAVVPKAAAPEQPAAAPAKTKKLTGKTFGRDPFKALIVEPVEVVSNPVGTTTDPSTTGSTGTTGTTAPTGNTSGSTTGGTTTTTTTPTASTAHSFRVVEVAPDNSRITVKVDGQVYRNLKAGEVFAKFFKVVLISGSVNAFQYGDDKFNVVGTKKLTIA